MISSQRVSPKLRHRLQFFAEQLLVSFLALPFFLLPMSLFRAAAWRKHPLLQYNLSDMLIGLPTGIAMFAVVKTAEATGLVTWDKHATPRKYDFVSAVYGAPPKDDAGHGHDAHGSHGKH